MDVVIYTENLYNIVLKIPGVLQISSVATLHAKQTKAPFIEKLRPPGKENIVKFTSYVIGVNILGKYMQSMFDDAGINKKVEVPLSELTKEEMFCNPLLLKPV